MSVALSTLAASSVFAEEIKQSPPGKTAPMLSTQQPVVEKAKGNSASRQGKSDAAMQTKFHSPALPRPKANSALAVSPSFSGANPPEPERVSQPGAAPWTGHLQIINKQDRVGLPRSFVQWDVGGHLANVGSSASHFDTAPSRMMMAWPLTVEFSYSAGAAVTTNLLVSPTLEWDEAYQSPALSQGPAAEDRPFNTQPALLPNQYYAGLIEERADTPALPNVQVGAVTWVSSPQISTQPPQEAIPVANVAVTSAGLAARISVCCRANEGSTPWQLTLDVVLTSQPDQDKVSGLDNPEMRQTGNVHGDLLSAKVLPQAPGQFRVLLSQTPADFDRNFKLLLSRPWIDIPLEFASGKKAVLTFTTGKIGADAIYAALRPGH